MAKTPLIELDNVFLKREDLNQTGSAKDRAIIYQIQNLKKKGFDSAVLSSTGNAAISAAYYCQQEQINLTVFLSPKVNQNKLDLLKKSKCRLFFSKKPISDAIKFSKLNNSYLLRQSTDPSALLGYQQIAKELLEQLPETTSIFIPIGSGTTLLGISHGLTSVKIFGAQAASNCPLAKIFDQDYQEESENITDALSAKYLPLKKEIIDAIKDSQGAAFVLQNQDILSAHKYLKDKNIETSLESALAFAAYQKAIKNNLDPGKYPVIILTGSLR